ncbi:hypothetical protein ADK70_04665 [Streptomyces rimosus subsp. pseudoverticillatus]|uniref:hypothetical protein n=1 Tax=Streptomyces rimosus TaxID=1927 RepID=UPI0006B27AA9|nr:hypothetical protein [Streptomyces rimosus]KOT99155.1 hypothetical protein ADK70_04665 [Streptomyces rimosus subsp. pseudoverticillatus]
MGMDITVWVVEWAHLMRLAPDRRLQVLQETVDGAEDASSGTVGAGWLWPLGPGRCWLGRYEFDGTLGSYTPHFRAANAWDAVRGAVPPVPRAAVDDFLAGLIWWGPDPAEDADHIDDGVFPSLDALWRSGPVIVRAPDTVAGLAAAWQQAQPLLSQLRGPYREAHAALTDSGHPAADFDSFVRLLAQWAEVLGEARRRDWGVIGLPM